MNPERRLAFGDIAELYDRARPSYPDALVDDVLAFAAPCEAALEVGSGTGKATVLFARRGLKVHALEPSKEMSRIGRRNCAEFEHVTVELSDFEDFGGEGSPYQLIYSAQAWHWVSPEARYVKARSLLAPGGALALFWNRARWESNPLREQLRAAYETAIPDFGPMPGPMYPTSDTPPELWGDWLGEIEASAGFGTPETRSYDWPCEYTTAEYLDVIQTHSDHIVLGPARLGRLIGAVAEVIDGVGGHFTMNYVALLLLARAG